MHALLFGHWIMRGCSPWHVVQCIELAAACYTGWSKSGPCPVFVVQGAIALVTMGFTEECRLQHFLGVICGQRAGVTGYYLQYIFIGLVGSGVGL